MRKILIPTDFSETSMNAIKYALELFKYDRSEIIIINAFADEVYENTMEMNKEFFEEFKEKFRDGVEKSLRNDIAQMLQISPNPRHNYTYKALFGTLVDETNRIIDKENIDLVVMGTKGKTDDENITFGSNTLQVMKYVSCPVMAVPVGYHDMHPKNILFSTDYMIPFKRRELKLISTIATNAAATINTLYIADFKGLSHRQLDNRAFLDCSFKDNKPAFLQAQGADLTKTINKMVLDLNIDMLVMANQRHSYLENILYRSTIEKIGLNIKIPFLVIQNLDR